MYQRLEPPGEGDHKTPKPKLLRTPLTATTVLPFYLSSSSPNVLLQPIGNDVQSIVSLPEHCRSPCYPATMSPILKRPAAPQDLSTNLTRQVTKILIHSKKAEDLFSVVRLQVVSHEAPPGERDSLALRLV